MTKTKTPVERPLSFLQRHIVALTRVVCCIVIGGTYNLSSNYDLLAPAFILSLTLVFHEYHRQQETKPKEQFEEASKIASSLYWIILFMFSAVMHYDRLINLNLLF